MNILEESKRKIASLKSIQTNRLNPYSDSSLNIVQRRARGLARARNYSTPMTRYSSVDSTTMYDAFLNPLIDKQHLEFPKDRVKRNERFWDYFQHQPLLSHGIRLLVEFPISNFTLVHKDPMLEDFWNALAEKLDLLTLLLNVGIQYYVLGEAIPFGFVDDPVNPSIWTDFILLNPDWATIHRSPIVRPRNNGSFGKYSIVYDFHRDPSLRKIVDNGKNNPTTKDLYAQIPEDILNSVRSGKPMKLPDLQASYFQRIGNYFTGRGESIIQSCVLPLMYSDKLREAQYQIADRHIAPTEIYKIGEAGQPAMPEELEAFDDAMQSVWNGSNKAIIWHHALQAEWLGATGKILPLLPEYQYIEKQLLTSLGLSEAFVFGSGPTFANASVSLEVLCSRFLTFRQTLENFMKYQIFTPICSWNKLYKKKDAYENPSKYKVKTHDVEYELPEIKWDKQNLREDREKINMIANQVSTGALPYEILWLALNQDPKMIKEKLQQQLKEMPDAPNVMAKKSIGKGEGLPGEFGSGMPLVGSPELGVGGEIMEEPGTDLMGGEGESETVPPESSQEIGLPTSI